MIFVFSMIFIIVIIIVIIIFMIIIHCGKSYETTNTKGDRGFFNDAKFINKRTTLEHIGTTLEQIDAIAAPTSQLDSQTFDSAHLLILTSQNRINLFTHMEPALQAFYARYRMSAV